MPDLSNHLLPPPLLQPPPLLPDPSCSSSSSRPENLDGDALDCRLSRRLRFPVSARGTCSVLKRERKGSKKASGGELLSEHVRVWTEKKVASGVPETECVLPFLTHSPKLLWFSMFVEKNPRNRMLGRREFVDGKVRLARV